MRTETVPVLLTAYLQHLQQQLAHTRLKYVRSEKKVCLSISSAQKLQILLGLYLSTSTSKTGNLVVCGDGNYAASHEKMKNYLPA